MFFLVEPTFEDLQKVELHLATSEVAISACEKGGAWEWALCLAEKMQILQLKLDVCTYSALITVCETWRQMDGDGKIYGKICGHVYRSVMGQKGCDFLKFQKKKRFGMMKYEMKHMKGFTIFHCFMDLIFFRNTDFDCFTKYIIVVYHSP